MTSTKKLNHHAAPLAPDVTDVQPIPNPDWNLPFADKLLYRNTTDDALLIKLNAAFKAVNEAATSVTTAKAELVSRSKTVGLLLVEARKLHPELKEFKAYLKQVDGGLKLSRAYDLMKLANGKTTESELKQQARERQQKSRAAKQSDSVTVTEIPKEKAAAVSAHNLQEFENACRKYLPKLNEADLKKAHTYFMEIVQPKKEAA